MQGVYHETSRNQRLTRNEEKIKLKVWCVRKKQNYRVTNEDEKWRLRNEDNERKGWGVRNEGWEKKNLE